MGGCGQSTPTAVGVVSLRAKPTARGVVLTWRTANELGIAGFNVQRRSPTGWRKVNPRLVPARGGIAGNAYRFVDTTAKPGRSYRYRLQVVGSGSAAAVYGPVAVRR
jgi:hypothetical protein